jgi:uncharacterized tellurite resistance protein B-like protein
MSLKKLSTTDRMRLMKFVCSFAWADLEVHAKERALINKLAKTLGLDKDELKQVEQWLVLPPRAEEVDPAQIPVKHRELFLDAVRDVVAADGKLAVEEKESLDLLQQLIR